AKTAIIETGRERAWIKIFKLHRQRKIGLVAPLPVAIFLSQSQCSFEDGTDVRSMRRAEDDARIINDLPSRRDALFQHHFTKSTKITQGIMRRRHHCDSIFFGFLEA